MKIGIIGGGILGVTLALRFCKKGHEVTVLEANEQLGGLTTWFNYGDFIWDKYYHVVLRSDQNILNLVEELSLQDKLLWTETKTGFLWNKQLLSMSNHWEFLTFPAINFLQKIRLALGLLTCQYRTDGAQLETLTAVNWLTTVFGKDVFAAIWEPLIKSKYGVLKDKVPASIVWSTIYRYASTRNKSSGKELMGYFKEGGYIQFFKRIENIINVHGGKILCNQAVQQISSLTNKTVLVKTKNNEFNFDRVISTVPSQLLNHFAPNETGLINTSIGKPEPLGVIRLALVLKEPLSPYYVTNLIQPGFSFTGIIGVTSLAGLKETADKHLVMIPRYDVPNSEWFLKSDDEIKQRFINELESVWPTIKNNILQSFVHKEKFVQALWVKAPPSHSQPLHNPNKTIWNVNAELAGRDTLNNNAIIGVANSASEYILQQIG